MFKVAERDKADADVDDNTLDMTFFKANEVDTDDGDNNNNDNDDVEVGYTNDFDNDDDDTPPIKEAYNKIVVVVAVAATITDDVVLVVLAVAVFGTARKSADDKLRIGIMVQLFVLLFLSSRYYSLPKCRMVDFV